ncbi:MAG: RnfABCDGE type electron transport complex subunit D [Clostridiaceae bacterium]|jgi:electron transport complex protein RnfD|nr:RnfABCDGE type electron transport complex subunit D [Clostridiaceae bacterium]
MNRGSRAELVVQPARFPHITRDWTTAGMMRDVLIALVPVVVGAVWLRGWRALAMLSVSVAICIAGEALACILSRKPLTIGDGSAAVTGILMALTLPTGTSLPALAAGALFAILVAKAFFGGLGKNLLNPALAGRLLVLLLWPLPPTALSETPEWITLFLRGSADPATAIGSVPALLVLTGAIYLYLSGVITLTAPLAFFATSAGLTWVFGGESLLMGSPVTFLADGGVLLIGFFLVSDTVTMPATRAGRLLFGAGAGLLGGALLLWAGTPSGLYEAILVLNACSPLIERVTGPRPSGIGRRDYAKP